MQAISGVTQQDSGQTCEADGRSPINKICLKTENTPESHLVLRATAAAAAAALLVVEVMVVIVVVALEGLV